MPGNTTTGLPYPLPSEPVRDGANAIKNLADAVDRRSPLAVKSYRGFIASNASGHVAYLTGAQQVRVFYGAPETGYYLTLIPFSITGGWVEWTLFNLATGAPAANDGAVMDVIALTDPW